MIMYEQRLQTGYKHLLREASQFFMNQGDLFQTLRNLARRLEREGIPYAVIGGMAMARHGLVRMTQDVDVLMTPEGLATFQARYVGRGYALAFSGARKTFRDAQTGVRIEVVTSGEYPGDGLPKPVAFPEPDEAWIEDEGIRVIALEKLVELKLASGTSAAHRLRDLADVQDLIGVLELPLDFAERLDASVRESFRELWRSAQAAGRGDPKRRED